MASIISYNDTGQTEAALPAVPEASPPPAAFGGQVAGQVEGIGSEIAKIAAQERMRASETRALQAETAYQDHVNAKVYDTQTGFSSLHGEPALAQSEEVKAEIAKQRDDISTSLNSRYAQRLFLNNSLRILRFAQNHVDAYAGQQRKAIGDQAYSHYVNSSAQSIATIAAAKGGYDQKAADDLLTSVQERAYTRASGLGLPQEAADDLAKKSLTVVVDSLLGTLSKTGNPKAQEEYDRWGDYLSPNKRISVEKALAANVVSSDATSIFQSAPRLNFARQGQADPDGMPDERYIQQKISELPEEKQPVAQAAMDKLMKQAKNNFDLARKARIGQVMADGRMVDGSFQIDDVKSADELGWLERNAPGGPGQPQGLHELQALERRDDKVTQTTDNEDSLKQLRATLVQKLRSDPAAFAKMTPADLSNEMLDPVYPGFSSAGMKQGQALLKSLQTSPKIHLLQSVPAHVEKALEGLYRKDVATRDKYSGELISELSEAMQNTPEVKWDDATINTFINRALDTLPKEQRTGFLDNRRQIDIRMEARQKGQRLQFNPATGEVRVVGGK